MMCTHGKSRYCCHVCMPDSSYFCHECHYTSGNTKYKGYCVPCYVYKFPEDELSKYANLKYAELKIKVFLAHEFPDVFTHNKRIVLGDCTAPYRRFLDFYVMFGNTLLAVEVDERQHRGYDKADEDMRVQEILHNIGIEKKMVFIRFNPDGYKVDGKQKRTGFENRLRALHSRVTEVIEYLETGEEYDDVHTEIKLFYDA